MPSQREIDAYVASLDRLILRNQAIQGADLTRIRAAFSDILRDLARTLPRTGVLDNATIMTLLSDLAERIDDLEVYLYQTIRSGVTAQGELVEKIFEKFGASFLEYGRSVPYLQLDPRSFDIVMGYTATLITNIGAQMRREVERELRMGALGLRGAPSDTIQFINKALGDSTKWSLRAERIYRTEGLRISSLLAQSNMEELNKITPIEKMWVWSTISRKEHAAIDGQIRPVDGFFDVPLRKGGISVKMRFPRDPAASAYPSAIINCGCYTVPIPPIGTLEGKEAYYRLGAVAHF